MGLTVALTRCLVVAAVGAAVTGCQVSHQAQADPVQFLSGQDVTLGGGQDAVLTGENLHLRFTDVLEDSRCPTQVSCFWTGQARITVDVRPGGSPSSTVEFNTNPAPGQNVQTIAVDGYTVNLKSLEPYPRASGEPIAFEDYRATLSVRKG